MDTLLKYGGQREINQDLANLKSDLLLVVQDSSFKEKWNDYLTFPESKKVITFEVEGGEPLKTLSHYEKASNFFLEQGIHRKAHLLAIGGGTVSDFSGFLASTLLRGLDWSIVPTTLLAMVDGAIGGKTALNTSAGKNLIGTFHAPKNIWFDSKLCQTLGADQLQNGYGEVLKSALLEKKIFAMIEYDAPLSELIRACSLFKREVVNKDFKEGGPRKFLNLGHTFGHAYEALTGMGHGLSVIWGIEFINKNFMKSSLSDEIDFLKAKFNLNVDFPKVKREEILSYVKKDKKKTSLDHVELIILEEVGRPLVKRVPFNEIEEILNGT